MGSSCHAKNAQAVAQRLQELILQKKLADDIRLTGAFCMGKCQQGVCVTVDGTFFSLSPGKVQSFFETEVLPKIHSG